MELEHLMRDVLTNDWSMVEAQLPKGWEELAVEHGALKEAYPKHLGAKITSAATLLRLVMMHVAGGMSLRITTALAAATGIASISPVALHKRMKTAGPWLGVLYARLVGANVRFVGERWAGYELIALDATTLTEPGGDGTAARVHYAMRLTDLRPVASYVTDQHGGETFTRFEAHEGQLWIGDRGYANPPGIAWMHKQGAHVLVRHNRGSLPLFDSRGRPINVLKRVRALHRRGTAVEWQAFVHPRGGTRIEGRLCALRLPTTEAKAARERARREQGSCATAETLEAAEYVMLFTTVPRDRLSAPLILELYRRRWQIELAFKREKSLGNLDALPNFRDDTIRTWIIANLLAQRLAAQLATSSVAFPPEEDGAALPSPAPRSIRKALAKVASAVVREAWRLTKLLSAGFLSALIPVRLADLPSIVPSFLNHLHRYSDGKPRQLDTFRQLMSGASSALAGAG